MRIAFVSFETVHHREREANDRFRTVVELLGEAGHDVHVLCARWWEGDARTFEHEGATYHAVSAGLRARRSFLLRLPVAIATLGPDVVHAAAEPASAVAAAHSGAVVARAPLVVEWYGDGGVPNDPLHRWAARRADRIVVPSRLVQTWVRELGPGADRVDVVANPIDVERIREVEPAEATDVVYARRLDDGANLESLLLGLAELRDREWSATVVGDGPERRAYEGLAADLRVDDRVDFVGAASRDERIAIYRGAHVFAQTAEFCVFPTEFCWGLAAGCVGVVEYHVNSSAHELVEGRTRGFRTTTPEELAEAIVDAGSLERRDFDEAFARFDRAAVRERYLEEYRELRESAGVF